MVMCPGKMTDAEELEIIRELETQLEPPVPNSASPDKSQICATPGPVRRLDSFTGMVTPGSTQMELSTPTQPKATPVKLFQGQAEPESTGTDERDAWNGWTTQSGHEAGDWWGHGSWMPRSWSSSSWSEEWGYGPQKQWWRNRGMSKDLEPYEGWSWGRGDSNLSLETDVSDSMQEALRTEVASALQRAPTSELDQVRPTTDGVQAAEEAEKQEKAAEP
ncbi:unnamed protein product, partial [Symbiodinium sp. CCMP2592]